MTPLHNRRLLELHARQGRLRSGVLGRSSVGSDQGEDNPILAGLWAWARRGSARNTESLRLSKGFLGLGSRG